METFVPQAARFALGQTLLLSSIAKLGNRDAFRDSVARFDLLPPAAIGPVASLLPRLELILGAMLAVGLSTTLVSFATTSLLALLTLAVTVNLARGRIIDCGCFGPFSQPITWWTLVRNVSLMWLGLVVVRGPIEGLALQDAAHGLQAQADALGGLIAGSSLVLASFIAAEAVRARRRVREYRV